MSTGKDVILCVILALTGATWSWHYANLSGRKTPPGGWRQTRLQKGAKGSMSCYCYCGWLRFV